MKATAFNILTKFNIHQTKCKLIEASFNITIWRLNDDTVIVMSSKAPGFLNAFGTSNKRIIAGCISQNTVNANVSSIIWLKDLDTFECDLLPHDFDTNLLHKELFASNQRYKQNWDLYVLQQWYLQHKEAFDALGINPIPIEHQGIAPITREALLKLRLRLEHKDDTLCNAESPILKKEVKGSRGETYVVTFDKVSGQSTCTCKGFQFRHTCKHIANFFVKAAVC